MSFLGVLPPRPAQEAPPRELRGAGSHQGWVLLGVPCVTWWWDVGFRNGGMETLSLAGTNCVAFS